MQTETSTPPIPDVLPWADRLRNAATLLVIIIHVSAQVAQNFPGPGAGHWWAGAAWDALGRPSVNLFVMLSGFLLFGKNYPTDIFLKKRFVRVLIPALFWMAVYLVYNFFAHGDPATLGQALAHVLEGPVHYHLWFIYLILGLYLMYPVLRPWVQQAPERDFRYFFVLCILGTWVYKTLLYCFDLRFGLSIELFTNHLGHFVLGYYLGNKAAAGEAVTRPGIEPWGYTRSRLVIGGWVLIALTTAVSLLATYGLSVRHGIFQPFFFDYLTPTSTMGAAGWMLLARHGWNTRPIRQVESRFAATSFGIYLIHVLLMDGLTVLGFGHSFIHPVLGIPVVAAAVALLSFAAVSLIRTLPFGKNIT
ncbi:MAG: acyltransferase family protein [Lewinellaceae bacterium]|nr:acyltransferase family protein [Saprospiraceae bacterium]MCB9333157.1 acyltransferase family protein [Lewinellaceae bacterium]